jgi:hypothetical protein
VTNDELRYERAAEYERLSANGMLAARTVAAPSPVLLGRGRLVGTIGLALGLALFALIVYAVIS